MKKSLLTLLVILIIVIAAACMFVFRNPSYYKTSIPFDVNGEKMMGIIQIGGSELDYDYTTVDKYFKTREFETIEFGGTEKYLIVPNDAMGSSAVLSSYQNGIKIIAVQNKTTLNVDCKKLNIKPYLICKDYSECLQKILLKN